MRTWTTRLVPRLTVEAYEVEGLWCVGLLLDGQPVHYWDWQLTAGSALPN